MNTNLSNADVERIVRLVVERILRESSSHGETKRKALGSPDSTELHLNERVVTLASLDGQLKSGVRALCVPAKAVVTPAVRDELRQRGIELRKTDKPTCAAERPLPQVIDNTRSGAASAWQQVSGIKREGNIHAAVRAAAAQAKTAGMCLILSETPEAVACLANRNQKVRAVVVTSLANTTSAVQSAGANTVVCDPARFVQGEVERLLNSLGQLQGSLPPDWLR